MGVLKARKCLVGKVEGTVVSDLGPVLISLKGSEVLNLGGG